MPDQTPLRLTPRGWAVMTTLGVTVLGAVVGIGGVLGQANPRVATSSSRDAPSGGGTAAGGRANSAVPRGGSAQGSTTQGAPATTKAGPAEDVLLSARSTGKFATAAGVGKVVGEGPRVSYAVAVETGIQLSPSALARSVEDILGASDGWASHGRWSLQRKATATDLVIRLATPETVDAVCATGGLRTEGYASCRVGRFVMLNLARWEHGIPEYDGDVEEYRRYLVNHEFGHGLGFGHYGCPGPGRPAPVMQQQTYGLKGCTKNGRPYVKGRLLTGPDLP